MTQTSKKFTALLAFGALALQACANMGAAYQPMVDGPRDARYYANLSDCQNLAKSNSLITGEVKEGAALGAAAGGLTVALDGDGNHSLAGLLGGALIGAAAVGGVEAYEARGDRKKIVIRCMSNRGHKVVG